MTAVDKDTFSKGMSMVFHGVGLIFESMSMDSPSFPQVSQEASEEPKAEEPAVKTEDAPVEKPVKKRAAKKEPVKAEEPKEEPEAEPKTEEPKAEAKAEEPKDAAPSFTYEQIVGVVTKRVNKAQAEGDTDFNDRLKAAIEKMGYSRISEMPAERYEEFLTILTFV